MGKDTSIAAAVLGIGPADLMHDLKSFGLFFEDMAVRDLNIYASFISGKVMHFRDSSLNKLGNVVSDDNLAFKMILTAHGSAYRRKDGIYVVPITCLDK